MGNVKIIHNTFSFGIFYTNTWIGKIALLQTYYHERNPLATEFSLFLRLETLTFYGCTITRLNKLSVLWVHGCGSLWSVQRRDYCTPPPWAPPRVWVVFSKFDKIGCVLLSSIRRFKKICHNLINNLCNIITSWVSKYITTCMGISRVVTHNGELSRGT